MTLPEKEMPPVLTNEEQYTSELKRIVRLTSGELGALEAAARNGDEQAKGKIIEECLHFVVRQAYRLSVYLRQGYLDLIQVGNLALVEHVDSALAKSHPRPYLCGIARREMRSYCFYNSRLIRVPEQPALLQDAPKTVSLEEWTGNPLNDLMAQVQPHEQAAFRALYGPLQEALATLTEQQCELVTRVHGLGEYGPETFAELGKEMKSPHYHYTQAIKHLRKQLKEA